MKNVLFDQSISRGSIERLMINLQRSSQGRLVLVDSPGGEFEFFSTICPVMMNFGLTTVALNVRSAANVLYLLGHNRFVLRESTFFFHEVRAISPDGRTITICDVERALDFEREIRDGRHELVEEMLRGIRNAQEWLIQFISRRTGMEPSTVLSLMRAEATLTAKDALRYGIAHRLMCEEELSEA